MTKAEQMCRSNIAKGRWTPALCIACRIKDTMDCRTRKAMMKEKK
jgi:hypothetical protein